MFDTLLCKCSCQLSGDNLLKSNVTIELKKKKGIQISLDSLEPLCAQQVCIRHRIKTIIKPKQYLLGNETLHLTWVPPVTKSCARNANKGNIKLIFLLSQSLSKVGVSLVSFYIPNLYSELLNLP